MNAPSREFMVRQSVLNAALPYADAAHETYALQILGTPQYLRGLTIRDYVRSDFCEQVRKEYRLLASRYQVAA